MTDSFPYKNASLATETRVQDLIGRMQVREKARQLIGIGGVEIRDKQDRLCPERIRAELADGIGQMNNLVRPLDPAEGVRQANEAQRFLREETRLGIPAIVHDETLHGLCCKGSISYPQSIAVGATWNPSLAERIGKAIGLEANSRGVHQGLSPTINIARDARCGRVEETYGEDSFLTARMGVAFVKAMQAEGVIATLKHFACNFVGDGGRDSHAVQFSERTLREVYFPAFEACVREGGALSVMSAYGSINGVPSSADHWLLTEVLRNEWGFKGIVVSDYASVNEIFTKHRTAISKADAGRQAIEAGLEVEFPFPACFSQIEGLVERGELSMVVLDEAVARVLRLKFDLGLFETPYREEGPAVELCGHPDHRQLALDVARQSLVLLKNDDALLPLKPELKTLAVIGPNADVVRLGGYSSEVANAVTPLEGIRQHAGATEVRYARGCDLARVARYLRTEDGDHFQRVSANEVVIHSNEILAPVEADYSGIEEAVELAKQSDTVVLCLGNSSVGDDGTEGESEDRCSLDLPGAQEALIEAVCAVNSNVVVLLINGSPVTMTRWVDRVQAIVECWYAGEAGGEAMGELLFGKINPSGKLPVSFPVHTGQCPIYYNMKPSGRTYGYCDLRQKMFQFPFGHGLSYTTFEYANLSLAKLSADNEASVQVSFELTNSGSVAGDEVVQVYVHDCYASLARPLKELKAFQRVTLNPGETQKVECVLETDAFSMLDQKLNCVVEPGAFEIMIGSSSEDIRLKGTVTLGG